MGVRFSRILAGNVANRHATRSLTNPAHIRQNTVSDGLPGYGPRASYKHSAPPPKASTTNTKAEHIPFLVNNTSFRLLSDGQGHSLSFSFTAEVPLSIAIHYGVTPREDRPEMVLDASLETPYTSFTTGRHQFHQPVPASFRLSGMAEPTLRGRDPHAYPIAVDVVIDHHKCSTVVLFLALDGPVNQWRPRPCSRLMVLGGRVLRVNEVYGLTEQPAGAGAGAGADVPLPEDTGAPCSICLTNRPNIVLLPCGHCVLCGECVESWRQHGDAKCPMCRTVVLDVTAIRIN
eukprot:gnl/Dysnectes_brevis/3471_a4399_902.p1 GENE.gnl/Dysnectes_brevis/3471_a4399_902~~gnl/Dysnectes_brevis/3471_a4399_902.p1  ORF type:complete len:289 (+),score=49.20 gnl/Dysnectes_brevis/3471_a4399_902:45-911(+)